MSVIALLASVGINIASNFASDAIKKRATALVNYKEKGLEHKRLYTVEELAPENIMGNKGEEQFGFRPDLFYHHPLMDEFAGGVLDKSVQMIVVTGRFASGKSRMVYEYLKSDICPFDNVYVTKQSDGQNLILKDLETLNPDNTAVVIDDINMYFTEDAGEDLGIGEMMRMMANRHIKTFVTLSMGELGYRQFLSCCERGNDIYRGSQHSAVFRVVEIPKIVFGDSFHQWCSANLRSGRFSTVVGGYVPGLQRSIDANINSITHNTKAMNVLVSFVVGSKYRHEVGRTDSFIRLMYTKRFGEISDLDYEDAIETLRILGYISNDLEYDGEGTAYKLSDSSIYFTFQMRCAQGWMGKTVWEVMANSADAEQRQCDWLLSCDLDNPLLYSRAIVHSQLAASKVYVRNKMDNHLKEKGYTMANIPEGFLHDPIPAILEFSGVDGYKALRKAVDENGLKPTIEIVNAIIRVAPMTMLKDEMLDYAYQLKERFSLVPTIYYYRCLEMAYDGYDVDCVCDAKELYDNDPDGEFMAVNYQRYSTELLCKAVNGADCEIFWNEIAPIGLELNGKSVQLYCDAINKNARNRLAERLYIDFWQKSANFEWDLNRTSVVWTLISSCPMFSTRYRLYRSAIASLKPKDYYDFAPDIDGLKCKLTLRLLDRLSYKRKDDIQIAHQLVAELLEKNAECSSEWYAGRIKILNKYLSRLGCYADFEAELNSLTNGDAKLIDGATIASAFIVVKTSVKDNKSYPNAVNDIRSIVALREKYHAGCEPMSNTSLYVIVRMLLERGLDVSTAHELLGYADGQIDVDNDMSRAARISCILTEAEAIAEADRQIADLDKVIESGKLYYNPDLISNLILAALTRFGNSVPLFRKIDKIIEWYERFIDVPNHSYYAQLLRYDLMADNMSVDSIIDEINCFNDRLLSARMPLMENNQDLFRSAVKSQYIDASTALALLHEVDRQTALDPVKVSLWNAKILKNFIEKLLRDETLTACDVEQMVMKDLQGLVDRHYDVDYTTEIDYIVTMLKKLKRQYNLPKYFALNFPLSSIYPTMRHQAWDSYLSTNSLGSIHDSSLDWFIQRERKGLSLNPNQDDRYLRMAIEEKKSRNL